MTPTVADLLTPAPRPLGLRGDPLLWDAMVKTFAEVPLPQDETTLRAMFLDTFETLTGTALLTAPDHIPVAALRRKNGGMSNGMVARSYWEGQMLPALIVRYHAANRA